MIGPVLRLFQHDLPLFFTGVLGLLLGGVCFAAMVPHGLIVEPEGNLYKAATFDIAVGLFVLTLALIERAAGLSRIGGAIWRWTLVSMVLFGYSVETVQIFRGFDPRFSRVSTPTDQMLGGFFFLSANVILLCFLALMARFFFRSTSGRDGALVLALRYGAIAATGAFTVGILMSIFGGPGYGDSGNLLPLHAAGFHGLQAVPLVALLLGWAGAAPADARKAVHAAGILWLAACASLAWQSFGGRSLLEPTLATFLALTALGAWLVVAAKAFVAFRARSDWRVLFAPIGPDGRTV